MQSAVARATRSLSNRTNSQNMRFGLFVGSRLRTSPAAGGFNLEKLRNNLEVLREERPFLTSL